MTDPNQNQEEKSTPDDGGEEVTVTREEFNALKKGVDKFFSEEGQNKGKEEESTVETQEEESTPSGYSSGYSSVVKKLYFDKTPEIEEVWDEVLAEAKAIGQDPIEYYESKKGWQLEAQSRAEDKRVKEQTKNNIESPSGTITGDSINFDKIKPEQIGKLDVEGRQKYREHLRSSQGGTKIIRSK